MGGGRKHDWTRVYNRKGIAPAELANQYKFPRCVVKKVEKENNFEGGCGGKWGKTFHQQDRVYDGRGMMPAINAMGNNGCVIRRWEKSGSDKQQKQDG